MITQKTGEKYIDFLKRYRQDHMKQLKMLQRCRDCYPATTQKYADWQEIIDRLRLSLFKDYELRKVIDLYFDIPTEYVNNPHECDFWLDKSDTKKAVVRKFSSRFYLVNVFGIQDGAVHTDHPEDYPGRIFPMTVPSSLYPEDLILQVIIEDLEKRRVGAGCLYNDKGGGSNE